jgi:hypothetical protein
VNKAKPMKTPKHLLFLLILLVLVSCNEQDDPTGFCGVTSIDELAWLRDEINSSGFNTSSSVDVRVYSAQYLGIEVIYIDLCCVNCLVTPPKVRTCNGTDLGFLGDDINENLVINRKVIWRTNNGFCQ